ncbi:MAG: polysaccharide deacetylase family protein [Syntrophomonas sp.]
MKKNLIVLMVLLLISTVSGCFQLDKNGTQKSQPKQASPASQKNVSRETIPPVEPPEQDKAEPSEQNKEIPQKQNTPSHSWYLTLNSTHQIPYVNPDIKTLLAENNAFYVLANNSNKIFLTFDCGYELGYTGQILDILKVNQIKAAFFITGQYINSQPDLVKRMKAEGNLVCNHTWSHPDCSTLAPDKLQQELAELEQEYTKVTGYTIDRYLRPPMGNYSAISLQATNQAGYSTVFWSIAFRDWDPNNQPGAEYSYQYVMKNIHPGAVILLHAVSKSDTEALDRIIKDLKNQGYVFATFNDRG